MHDAGGGGRGVAARGLRDWDATRGDEGGPGVGIAVVMVE